MSSEYIKHNGQKVKRRSVIQRGKKYRYNRSGQIEEITNEATLSADDFVINATKSSLKRISDLEQNVAMIYTRLTTSDGASEAATSEDSDDVAVGKSGKTTRFKGDVKFEGGIDISASRWSNNVSTSFADAVVNKSNAYVDVSVSNDTLTFTTGDGATKSVTTSDANSNTYLTNAAFNTSNGVLTLTRNSGSVTVDLDGRYAYPSDITTAINNLVDGAPAALNTLNELAAAIGDNASYASSITTALSGKASTGTVMTAGNGLTGGGNLGANRTFHVGGGNGITVSADGVAMSGSYTGTFTASGDVCAYSDASLKTNVKTIDGALSKVEAVRGVTFDRIADGSTSTGVVAQELEAVLPEAVQTDANGTKMVAYGNITGLLIEAVKELSAEVKSLKGE
jgi:hypothetical protein